MNKSDIIKWRHEYNIGNEKESKYEIEILESIGTGEIKTWEDLKSLLFGKHGILSWKGALRTKNYYESLDSSKWNLFFEIIKCSKDNPKDTVKNIVNFSRNNMNYNGRWGGISYPVASTLVYFFSEGQCPIIDWKAVFTLEDNGFSERLKKVYSDDGWDNFYDLCNELVLNLKLEPIENDTSLRVLDKALWKYPDLKRE